MLLLGSCTAGANPGLESPASLRSNVRSEVFEGPFSVPSILRERVDFWKEIFTKYGAAHSVIHHRDFPQIVFGVIDLTRERDAMSPTSFDAYKSAVVKRTLEDLQSQMLDLATTGEARTPFQERVLDELGRRRLPVGVLRSWVEGDLIRTQTGIRERYAEAMRRAWRYLPVMEQIFVAEYGLPKELTRIPFIESSFDYTAYSSVGAAGIWQFMPKTARAHRMLVGKHVDERRDPIRATRAAAEYLRSAYNSLGAWPLAITSYNHGVGGVRSKVRAAGTDDLATIIEDPTQRYFGFASTNFYPEFLAAVEIFENHARYFPEIPEEAPLRVASYSIQRSVGAPFVASKLGISIERLREANYGLMESVWSGRASIPSGYTLRVPLEYRNRADQLFGLGVTERVLPVSLRQAERHREAVAPQDVSEVQQIQPLQVDELMIEGDNSPPRRKDGAGAAVRIKPSASSVKRKQAATRSITVRAGDTLGGIAKRYGVRIERIKQLNGLRGSKVVVGQKLLIPKN